MARAATSRLRRTATTSQSTSITRTTPIARTTQVGAVRFRPRRTGSRSRFAPARRRLLPGMGQAPKRSAKSAGLVLYRRRDGSLEVLLVHPGGPFWQRRDEGVWSIPKGEFGENEVGIDVARREFQEELGTAAPEGEATPLGEVRQAGGKVVHAWALPGDLDVTKTTSNTFEIEWPPRPGKLQPLLRPSPRQTRMSPNYLAGSVTLGSWRPSSRGTRRSRRSR